MTARLDAALAELAAAIRQELRDELATAAAGPPELLSVAEAARRLSIGRSLIYDMIGRGELRSVRIGRRRVIPADALAQVVDGEMERSA